MNSMEYGKAFSYLTEDPDWIKKFLIAAGLSIIPLLGQLVVVGYGLEITRRVIKGETPTLPEWSDFGDFLKKGFFAAVVTIVYTLPSIIFSLCAQGPQIALAFTDDETTLLVATIVAVCFGCLTFIVAISAGLLTPAALGKVAASGELGAGFRLGEVFGLLRAKPGVYVIIFIILAVMYLVLVPVGMLACFIGIYAVVAYAQLVSAHLYGQAYRVASAESGA